MAAAKKKATTKKQPFAGRNRYPQKCGGCGLMVSSGQGFLKKRPKGLTGYEVYHEACKPGPVTETSPSKDEKPSEILGLLESTLIDRQLRGEPVVHLPKIIDYIKELEAKVAKYA